jgi:hypothetical protein
MASAINGGLEPSVAPIALLKGGISMSYLFQMYFRGLCAFVPSEPIDKKPYPQHVDSITVLVPNLLISKDLRKRQVMSSHYPCIAFDMDQRQKGSTREPDFIIPGKPSTGLCFLNGEDLSFPGLPPGGNPGLDLKNQPASDPEREKESLFWLAKMERAKKGAGVLRKGLVRPSKPKREEILGRLVMDRGIFKSSYLTSQIATFDDYSTYRQVIAWELLWEVPGVTGVVEIDFSFIDPAQGRSTKLLLAPGKKDEGVDLTLRNLEIEAFIAKYQGSRGKRGKDFEIHYGLSKASRGRHPVPVLPTSPSPPDSVHELCPPTLFQRVQK